MLALGIETSCDDTCVALVRETGEVLLHHRQNQNEVHKEYGGVVPELASRNHGENLLPLIEKVLKEVSLEKVDVIGVTNRPGLLGSLLVGCVTAQSLNLNWKKPLYGINHIEGHIFSPFLWTKKNPNKKIKYPFLAFVVSGGHSHLFQVKNTGEACLLGGTLDDSAGEALDKFAKLLKLPWPGGPHIESEALKQKRNQSFFKKIQTPSLSLSFSGIKSAGKRLLEGKSTKWIEDNLGDLCADYQKTIVEHLMLKLDEAFQLFPSEQVLFGGGVVANKFFRKELAQWGEKHSVECLTPEQTFCTDNAAMIGFTALQYFKKSIPSEAAVSCSPQHLENDFFTLNKPLS